jgi:hypothetical protein
LNKYIESLQFIMMLGRAKIPFQYSGSYRQIATFGLPFKDIDRIVIVAKVVWCFDSKGKLLGIKNL